MVPRVIHQIKGRRPSKLVTICLESWKVLEQHDFKIMYWNDETLEKFIRVSFPFALDAFVNARNHAEAADIARYLLVYYYGGYYVDWDISINNVNQFLDLHTEEPFGYLLIDPLNLTLASEHFSAQPEENYLLSLVKDIVNTYDRYERELMATPQYSGPYRMKTALRRCQFTNQSLILVKEVFEYNYQEIRTVFEFRKAGIMTHYWEHSWVE